MLTFEGVLCHGDLTRDGSVAVNHIHDTNICGLHNGEVD